MDFTQLHQVNSRKRCFVEQGHGSASSKYRKTYESLCLSIHSTCIFLDFNQSYENVQFHCTETTDQYRPGLPYKLLHYPLKSFVEMVFSVSDFDYLSDIQLGINCCTGHYYQGKIDIIVNNIPFLLDYTGTACSLAFREHNLSVPKHAFVNGENIVKVQLSNQSPGVVWVSDVRITALYHVK